MNSQYPNPKNRMRVRPPSRFPGTHEDQLRECRKELAMLGIKPPYDIGYKKPPKHTQWKKGQSGNISGLPKKGEAVFDVRAQVQDLFLKEVTVKDANSKRRKVPLVLALIMQKQKEAVTDFAAFREVMRLAEKFEVFKVVRRPQRKDFSHLTPEQREMAISGYLMMMKSGIISPSPGMEKSDLR